MGEARCSRCGANLAPDAPEGLCSACVLQIAVEDSRGEFSESFSGGPTSLDDGPLLRPGDTFGPYRIDRLLGRGGMGDVYAADHIEQGRRLALKLLSRRLAGAEDRERFLREGQLAAAVNHPHSVYVYGSEEIAGTPAITMELLSGGTLKDRVRMHGPMGVTQAADAILQVASGLEAAQRSGILHRDVKPSNCFIDFDESIKVGDFGLSIPTQPSAPEPDLHSCAFHGTPGFAPPEQLRGEALDLRADIYAVGATLYYLLTGEAPGGHRGLSALVAGMDVTPVRALSELRQGIPAPLTSLVQRCLSVDRSERPSSYAELMTALAPFGSAQPEPAPLGRRIAATVIDSLVLFPIGASCMAAIVGSGLVTQQVPAVLLGMLLPAALYWSITEGVSGAGYGKRACGLRVIGPHGEKPGVRGLVRALIFIGPVALTLASVPLAPLVGSLWPAPGIVLSVLTAGLWSTLTRTGAFRGIHELLSGTRVILSQPAEVLPEASTELTSLNPLDTHHRQIGPYSVVASLGPTDSGELLLALDPRLKRQVWIHVLPLGVDALPRNVKEIGRTTRLRWLTSQRSSAGAWDAYEAPGGTPLLDTVVPVPWSTARKWLHDLANELDASLREGSLGALSLDRVWITRDLRAKVLMFRSPGLPDGPTAESLSPMNFLRAVIEHILGRSESTAVPLTASAIKRRLTDRDITTPATLAVALLAAPNPEDTITRRKRSLALTLSVLTYLFGASWLGARLAALLGSLATTGAGFTLADVHFLGALGATTIALGFAAFWRSGFWLRVFGIAIITDDGQEVSRRRAVARASVVWASVIASSLAGVLGFPQVAQAIGLAQLVSLLYASHHPHRGLHDRLMGTFLVPR